MPININFLCDSPECEGDDLRATQASASSSTTSISTTDSNLSNLNALTLAAQAMSQEMSKGNRLLPSITQMLPEHFPVKRPAPPVLQPNTPNQAVPLPLPHPPQQQHQQQRQPQQQYQNHFQNKRLYYHSVQQPIQPASRPAPSPPQSSSFMVKSFKMDKRSAVREPSLRVGPSNAKEEAPVQLDATVQALIASAKALNSGGSGNSGNSTSDSSSASASTAVSNLSVAQPSIATDLGHSSHAQPNQAITLNFRNYAMNLGHRSTNLTSNQYGTAVSDKSHYAAVMTDSVLCTSLGVLEHFADEYQPTVNNKLKGLKFMEFLQERFRMHFCQSKSAAGQLARMAPDEDLAVAFRLPEALQAQYGHCGGFHLLRQGAKLGLAVYQAGTGRRLYSSLPHAGRFVSSEVELVTSTGVTGHDILNGVKEGDMVFLLRLDGPAQASLLRVSDALAQQLASLPPGCDLDSRVDGIDGVAVVAVVGSHFDSFYKHPQHQIRHTMHTERKGHVAVDQPWSYAITKHPFLVRSYLAMIYSDASKINRFPPTIEFVIRKAAGPDALGCALSSRLEKLSDIQHLAGVMITRQGKLRYWGTGGAFFCLIDRSDASAGFWPVSFPGLDSASASSWTSTAELPVGEIDLCPGAMIYLLCPAIRLHWQPQEIKDLLGRPNRALPEKLTTLMARLTSERDLRSGVGVFEII